MKNFLVALVIGCLASAALVHASTPTPPAPPTQPSKPQYLVMGKIVNISTDALPKITVEPVKEKGKDGPSAVVVATDANTQVYTITHSAGPGQKPTKTPAKITDLKDGTPVGVKGSKGQPATEIDILPPRPNK
jgi:hypothetical protein